MIDEAPIALLIPGLTSVFNRIDRGEDSISRRAWYATMATVYFLLTFDPLGTVFYTLFVMGYAMLPWQAEYAIVTESAPGRKDSRWFYWMQTLAFKIKGGTVASYTRADWRHWGIIYGQIRGLWMVPCALLMTWHLHSYVPLSGIAIALAYPWVMVTACAATDHWGLSRGYAPLFEQLTMGYLIGTYMLACAG